MRSGDMARSHLAESARHASANDSLVAPGHYHLWLGGVEHNDISVKILMYDKLSDHALKT